MSQREPVVEVIFAREKATRKKAKARQCDSRPQSPSRQYTWPSHFELIRSFQHNFEMSDENGLNTQNPRLLVNEFYKKGCQEKSSPSTGGREGFVSRSSPLHCKSASRLAREVLLLSCLPFLWLSLSGGDHANRVLRHGKRDGCLSGNHSSIGGSWLIAISGYPRRHSVIWGFCAS